MYVKKRILNGIPSQIRLCRQLGELGGANSGSRHLRSFQLFYKHLLASYLKDFTLHVYLPNKEREEGGKREICKKWSDQHNMMRQGKKRQKGTNNLHRKGNNKRGIKRGKRWIEHQDFEKSAKQSFLSAGGENKVNNTDVRLQPHVYLDATRMAGNWHHLPEIRNKHISNSCIIKSIKIFSLQFDMT